MPVIIAIAIAAIAALSSLFAPNLHTTLISEALPLTSEPAPAPAPAPASASSGSQYFAGTGKSVQGEFLRAFQKYGLARIGYPISWEVAENGLRVQYFERVRMEYHPELASKGTPVLFSPLGLQLTGGIQFAKTTSNIASKARLYFQQTGHSLASPFLSYWRDNGGAALFGYPISEDVQQDGLRVQWFERARMEYHPELAAKTGVVQLTLLGAIVYNKALKSSMARVAPAPTPPQAQVTALVVSAPPPTPMPPTPVPIATNPPDVPVQLNDMEDKLLEGINAQRTAAGLAPVALSGEVTALARARSSDMAARSYFAHTTPEGSNFLVMLGARGIGYTYAGEILQENNYQDENAVQDALTSFLDSPPHKEIMLDGRFEYVGVGYAKSPDGVHYFTAIFIRK